LESKRTGPPIGGPRHRQPGHVERREFEYFRHGTKALIAAFDVASSKVRGTIGDTRTEADFVSFLENLFASASTAR
jgi:hypothetical protein